MAVGRNEKRPTHRIKSLLRLKEDLWLILQWIHLSDWHQQVEKSTKTPIIEAVRVLHALVDDIHLLRDTRLGNKALDFAVFSGDVAFSGNADEFAAATECFIKPVLTAAGVPAERAVVVPGNHDFEDGFISDPSDIGLMLTPKCFPWEWINDQKWNDWLADQATRDLLRRPFQAFRQFAFEVFGLPEADWAYQKRLTFASTSSPVHVELSCFNSALFCRRILRPILKALPNGTIADTGTYELRFDEYGELFIGAQQLSEGVEGLSETGFFSDPCTLRIAVVHHPVSWLLQPDRIVTRNHLTDCFDFLLVGHEHEQRVLELKGTQGECIIVPAGPAFDAYALRNDMNEDYPYGISYNIVQLDTKTGEGIILLRRYDKSIRNSASTALQGAFVNGYQSRFPRGEYHFKLIKPVIPKRKVSEVTPEGEVSWRNLF